MAANKGKQLIGREFRDTVLTVLIIATYLNSPEVNIALAELAFLTACLENHGQAGLKGHSPSFRRAE